MKTDRKRSFRYFLLTMSSFSLCCRAPLVAIIAVVFCFGFLLSEKSKQVPYLSNMSELALLRIDNVLWTVNILVVGCLIGLLSTVWLESPLQQRPISLVSSSALLLIGSVVQLLVCFVSPDIVPNHSLVCSFLCPSVLNFSLIDE
jgi:hypothetical protein